MSASTASHVVGWLTPEAAAEYSGFSKGTLANWRTLRNTGANPKAGPDFEKVGARIRYAPEAIDRFVREQGAASRTEAA